MVFRRGSHRSLTDGGLLRTSCRRSQRAPSSAIRGESTNLHQVIPLSASQRHVRQEPHRPRACRTPISAQAWLTPNRRCGACHQTCTVSPPKCAPEFPSQNAFPQAWPPARYLGTGATCPAHEECELLRLWNIVDMTHRTRPIGTESRQSPAEAPLVGHCHPVDPHRARLPSKTMTRTSETATGQGAGVRAHLNRLLTIGCLLPLLVIRPF
jgi:hypothetical protein